uniref:Uncharacterized protein n=1 Tax=Oryza brachyantha TaxID=4533 RepID=J3KYS5_ORYBR
MRTMKACSVPFVLAALAVLSCVFLVHGLYGLIELFGSPDLSPEATLLIFALCFLVLAAAAAVAAPTSGIGYRRSLLPREAAAAAAGMAGVEGELPVADEETVGAGGHAVDMQTTQDYPGSGANSRHDPRNPH